jgi:hypothetical protein
MARAFLGFATALLGVLVFATAAPAASTSETINGNGAVAEGATVNGCVERTISITAGTQLTKSSGTVATEADITITGTDICLNRDLGTFLGLSTTIAYSADLNGATLNGSIDVPDSTGNNNSVPVSLVWTGTGTITRAHNTIRIVTGNVTTFIHTRDASRIATVTGTVDGLPLGNTSAMLLRDATITRTTTH